MVSRLGAHEELPGHGSTVRTVQRHGEDIRGLERDTRHLKDSVDQLRTEQRQGFDRLDDKLEQILRQR